MNQDSIDGPGKPFEPETPEEFFQRGEEAFQIWWDELDPPGSSGGLELDCETARAVWLAAYEYSADCIMLVYDGARANVEGAHPTGEMYLACVVDRHHNGSISFLRRDFFDWVAEHEDHIRHEYSDDQLDADADMVTVWIDHAGNTSATPDALIRRSRASSDALRNTADQKFAKWWSQLHPPRTLAFRMLDREEAQLVWREAFTRLWEDLEAVHDSAKAHADVIAETARLELAYLIDRFHGGRLSLAVNDVEKYWNENKYVLERRRSEEMVSLRVRCLNQDR